MRAASNPIINHHKRGSNVKNRQGSIGVYKSGERRDGLNLENPVKGLEA